MGSNKGLQKAKCSWTPVIEERWQKNPNYSQVTSVGFHGNPFSIATICFKFFQTLVFLVPLLPTEECWKEINVHNGSHLIKLENRQILKGNKYKHVHNEECWKETNVHVHNSS